MTKKDYILIAETINGQREAYKGEHDNIATNVMYGLDRASKALADALGKENPKFDSSRFLSACGVTK